MDPPEFNELTLALLTAIARERGQFVIPIIRHQPSGWIIDGNHRLEVIRRLAETDPGLTVGHRYQDDYSPDPAALAIELNKARRPWDDAEERRTQAQILAATPVPGGRSGKGGGKNGKPPEGTIAPPSARQIAEVLGVDEVTVRRDLKGTAANAAVGQTPSAAGDLPESNDEPVTGSEPRSSARLSGAEVRSRLRQLCKEHNAPRGIGPKGQGVTSSAARAWLREQGIPIPPELDGASRTITSTIHQSAPSANGNLETATAEPEAKDSKPAVDPTEHLNAEQLRDHCAAEVAKSDRPDDYKRAIQLLAELDHIITAAWRRQHPEPWIAGDWSHVSGELQALHSIAHQRAVELSEAIVQRFTAVTVASSRVS